MANVRNSFASL